MSLVGKRQQFATALSTVDDVTGYLAVPGAPRAGDAWPQWGGADREDGYTVHSWSVVVCLPQDQAAADLWITDHLDDLYDALRPVAYVEDAKPANLSQSGTTYGLVITTRSE